MKLKALLLCLTALIAAAPLQAQTDDALASRLLARRSAPPTVLSDAERSAYAEVFAAIRASDWKTAAARLDTLGQGPLQAIARAELYLAKDSPKVELEQLVALLTQAPDMPQATQIARLAETRGAVELPPLPQPQRLVWAGGQPRRARAKSVEKDAIAAQLEAIVQPMIRDNQPAPAETALVAREAFLPPEVLTEYRHRIAWSYYIVGDLPNARRLADRARAGIGEWVIQAEWLTGLAAWRMRDCTAAATSFATVAARATDLELSAAGYYWAARADMICGKPEYVQTRLRAAARLHETFYGLLAQSALAMKSAPRSLFHDYRDGEWNTIATKPNVKAAIALVEIGERGLADEVIKHQAKISPSDHYALLHLACDLDLTSTQIWLAHNAPPGARIYTSARYPTPRWRPINGWRVDPSLVFAHTLQESGFRADVVSPAGAVGLMQVRPGTAGDMARARAETFDPRTLTDPAVNAEFGQRYLEYLRDNSATGGLLPKVIAAFNAGPLPVSDWNVRDIDDGDPLLYIESIPYWETRGYVPIILRNYWIYEESAGHDRSPTREALVQGLWPRFPGMKGPTAVRIAPRAFAAMNQ